MDTKTRFALEKFDGCDGRMKTGILACLPGGEG
jgi:hypothetical protein